MTPGCVTGNTLVDKKTGKTLEECKKLCETRLQCKAIMYGVNLKGSKGNFAPKDCVLKTSAETKGCDAKDKNMAVYVKHCEYGMFPRDFFSYIISFLFANLEKEIERQRKSLPR